ncbi:MAG: hypothetical protein LBP22_03275 [Deltaproteobacteria bacterium]|nr:hypothetical protein [Deltaproteobacteria bacterium]
MSDATRTFDPTGRDVFSRDLLISSIMMYPESPKERSRYATKALIEAAARHEDEEIRKSPERAGKVQMNIGAWLGSCLSSFGGWRQMAGNLLFDQQPDFYESLAARMRAGAISGWLLDLALTEQSSIQKAAIAYCEEYQDGNEFIDRFKGLPGRFSFDLSEENLTSNIWGEFQGAAHLWAAFIHFEGDDTSSSSGPPRPYFNFNDLLFDAKGKNFQSQIPNGFDGFCLVAEWYRQNGIKFKPLRSTKPLLSPARSWRVPPAPEVADGNSLI